MKLAYLIILKLLHLAGAYLSHGGTAYKNFSVFSISEIGNDNMGFQLQCTTDKSPCCKNTHHRFGEWIFPDMSSVPVEVMSMTFYRNRGDDGTVNLNRLNSSITSPTGLFCCEVPDGDEINQTLCANIGKLNHFLNNTVIMHVH